MITNISEDCKTLTITFDDDEVDVVKWMVKINGQVAFKFYLDSMINQRRTQYLEMAKRNIWSKIEADPDIQAVILTKTGEDISRLKSKKISL